MPLAQFLLWRQLASPIHAEREAAARELGEIVLADPDRGGHETIDWIARQRDESRCVEALLPLVWAKLRNTDVALPHFEDVVAAYRYPSLLATRLLIWLYNRAPTWDINAMYDPSHVPDVVDARRFSTVLGSAPGFYRNVRPPYLWRERFHDLFLREYAIVDRRLGRPNLNKMRYGQVASSYIPNFETQAVEALTSGFHRAFAAATAEYGAVASYEWAGAPVVPGFWFAPSATADPALIPLLSAVDLATTIGELEVLRAGQVWPARVHARVHHTKRSIVDLEVGTFYQRVEGYGMPSPHEVLSLLSPPQLRLPGVEPNTIIEAQTAEDWHRVIEGWSVLPATITVSGIPVTLWQAELCLRAPSVPLCDDPILIETEQRRTLAVFVQNGNTIGTGRYWVLHPDLMRSGEELAPVGVATVLNGDFVRSMAASLRAVPAQVIRRTVYSREHDYDEFESSIEEAFLGTTDLLLP